MIRIVLGLLGSGNGMIAAIVAAVVSFLAYAQWIKYDAGVKAVAEVVEASRQTAGKADAESEKARADARKPGAAERLRNDKLTCRDCGQGRESKAVPKLATPDGQPARRADRRDSLTN